MAKKIHYDDSPSEKQRKSFTKYLAEDEDLIVATGFGSAYLRSLFVIAILWPGFVFFFLVLGLAYLLGYDLIWAFFVGLILSLVAAFIRTSHIYHANRYLLTTRRVVIKNGIFTVRVMTALYDKVTHIEVEQSFSDKLLFHHGNIIIHTAGSNKDEIMLKYVDSPIELKNLLERLINRERELMGGRSGSVVTLEGELV